MLFGSTIRVGDPLQPLSREAYRGAVRLMYGAEALLVAVWLLLAITTKGISGH